MGFRFRVSSFGFRVYGLVFRVGCQGSTVRSLGPCFKKTVEAVEHSACIRFESAISDHSAGDSGLPPRPDPAARCSAMAFNPMPLGYLQPQAVGLTYLQPQAFGLACLQPHAAVLSFNTKFFGYLLSHRRPNLAARSSAPSM